MRLTAIVIYIFLISVVGLTAHSAVPDNLHENQDLAYRPSLSNYHYDKVISRIKDAFQEWNASDRDDYPRLILLGFGIVGVIGIRRTVKKPSSAQKISRRNANIAGIKSIA